MRRLLLLLFIAPIALQGFAAKRVTVQQFEQLVTSVHGRRDADAAEKFLQLQLTERLSAARVARIAESMPGPLAKGALLVLADASTFLRLPADEIPVTPTPDPDAQRALLDAAGLYVRQTLSRLPNFFATRETTLFMDAPPRAGSGTVPADQSLLFAAQSSETVLYRNGKQVVETGDTKSKKHDAPDSGLIVSGEFGPILGTVLADASQGELAWSHWEQRGGSQEAVFHYAVSKAKSHYEAMFCCVALNGGRRIFKRLTEYHGEIAIDPATGTILRLTMQADLKPAYPMARADLAVDYGPVDIGGKTYICPVKSVAIAQGYEGVVPDASKEPLNFGPESVEDSQTRGSETLQTMLNHIAFREYHLFRSETRILSEGDRGADSDPPASAPLLPTAQTSPSPH